MKITFKNSTICSAIAVMAAILLAACGNAGENENHNSTNQATGQEAVEVAPMADSGISFKDENGKIVSLSSLKGQVVFINFWATWCPPCIQEMPSINDLKKSFEGNSNIAFLMVDVDNKIAQSTAFMTKNNYDLPVYTPASDIPSDFLAGAIPTTVILDKSGEMVGR
ncbi:MAG TPA: TlpA disulfide reductase family protein, partial [Parapedobacter sp.]|nr:TlpA disulfide reductase family protein [Parapedobacter sp.]